MPAWRAATVITAPQQAMAFVIYTLDYQHVTRFGDIDRQRQAIAIITMQRR
jgi:hypothetical protein